MAMEDAYSLATCLQLGGKSNIPLAVRVHNHLRWVEHSNLETHPWKSKTNINIGRFERVSSAQKMGFRHRETFHNTDWDAVAKNPDILSHTTATWIMRHNPEQYAYDNYGKVVNHLLKGAPFENTNLPPGYKYKPWTVKELMDASDRKQPIVDEGDWF